MEINCPICANKHNIEKLLICDNIFTGVITKYLKEPDNYIFNNSQVQNTVLNKIFKCFHCDKILSSKQNLDNHINSGICVKSNEPNEFKCSNCDKKFSTKQRLNYHLSNNVCSLINSKNKNTDLIQQNNTTNNSNNTTTNTSNTTNIGTLNNQNNVVINVNPIQETVDMLPFRDVCYKIPTKKYLEYANNPDQAIKQFVKDYHLNPDKPERMNILNTNRRDNRVQLFDFDEDFICRWQTKDKSKVLELLCDRGVNALFFAKTMLTAAGIKLDPDKETKLNAKIKEYESSDKVKKKYVDMIGDLTYDYRDMVESNKKKYSNLIKN